VFRQRVIYSVGNWHAETCKEFEEEEDTLRITWSLSGLEKPKFLLKKQFLGFRL